MWPLVKMSLTPLPRAQCLPAGGTIGELTQLAPLPCEAREAGAGVGGIAGDTVVDALAAVEARAQGQTHRGCGHRRSGMSPPFALPDPKVPSQGMAVLPTGSRASGV